MKAQEKEHVNSTASGNAPDVTKKANLVIWFYFVVFGLALYAMIVMVDIYFRIGTEREYDLKIGSVISKELIKHRADEAEVLSGKKGIIEGKKNISIDTAMAKMLEVIK